MLLLAIAAGLALTVPSERVGGQDVSGGEAGAPRVLLVIIDRIGLDDITESDAPNILRLAGDGCVGLMNARVKYDAYGLGSYLVIGAGGRALGGSNVGLAFNSSERLETAQGDYIEAEDVYRSRTGQDAPGGSVVNLFIEEMKKKSEHYLATSLPGLMGQALKESGRRVGLLGNADSLSPSDPDEAGYRVGAAAAPIPGILSLDTILHREASCVAMDADGVVGTGDVSGDLYRYSADGTGLTTDFEALTGKAAAMFPSLDILVVDMGQTSRVDQQAYFYADDTLDDCRAYSLRECDRALGTLLDLVDLSRDLVIVCTPTPTREMLSEGDLLTPLVIAGPGITAAHCAVPVSHLDVAPTLIGLLGLSCAGPGGTGSKELADVFGVASDGRSLRTYLQGGAEPVAKPIFIQYSGNSGVGDLRRAIVDGKLKYVHDGEGGEELFDLEIDPTEMTNIVGDPAQAGSLNRLRGRCAEWARSHGDSVVPPEKPDAGKDCGTT